MKKNKPLVSIIITNHNGRVFLIDCIQSIYQQTYRYIEVILVDNASSDQSIEIIRKRFPRVFIKKNRSNIGFAGGNNSGYKRCKGEFILILNNDTILKKDLIETLLRAFDEIPHLGAVQPMIKLMNSSQLDACGSFWTFTGFNYHYGIYKNSNNSQYHNQFPVYSLKGVCMLIRREVVEKVGLFDDNFWCYFEETDFCNRVWLAGYECWYYPKTHLFHYLSGTRLKYDESFIQFHSFKNRLCSYIKNLEFFSLLQILPIYLTLNIFVSFIYLFKSKSPRLFLCIYKAIWWNIQHIGNTLTKRRYIYKKIRKKSDKSIFDKVAKNPRISYYYYLVQGLRHYKD